MNEPEGLLELRHEPPLENVKVGHAVIILSMTMRETEEKRAKLRSLLHGKQTLTVLIKHLIRSIGNPFFRTLTLKSPTRVSLKNMKKSAQKRNQLTPSNENHG